MKPIYEFILWNTCSNNCAFCHQKANKAKYPGKFPTGSDKLVPIQLVRFFLKANPLEEGSHILLMGGELFDTRLEPAVEKELLVLAEEIAKGMWDDKYGFLYVNTNLIYENLTPLFTFLDVFKSYKVSDRIKFTTSFDPAGYRYKSDNDCELAEHNMDMVTKWYPEMSRVANCILTDKAIAYFKEHECPNVVHGFALHLIPYIILHKEQAVTRKELLDFMVELEKKTPGFLEDYAMQGMCEQPRYIYEFDGKHLKYASSGNSACGHNENFMKVYKDSDACFVCDCEHLKEIL